MFKIRHESCWISRHLCTLFVSLQEVFRMPLPDDCSDECWESFSVRMYINIYALLNVGLQAGAS